MKKFLIISIIVFAIVLVCVAGAVFFLQKAGGPVVIEEILPQNAIAYLHISDIEQNFDDFIATDFWKGIASIDYPKILKENGASEEELAPFVEFQKQFSSSVNQEIFKKFFGQDVAVAVYPTQVETIDSDSLGEIISNIYFVTRLKPEARFAEMFSGALSNISKDITVAETKYNKHKLNVVTIKDSPVNIVYVAIGDVVVFGLGEKVAQKCLDVLDKKEMSLSQDPQYLQTKASFLENAEATNYINFSLLISTMKEQIIKVASKEKDNPDIVRQQIDQGFQQMRGFRSLGYSGIFDNVSKIKFALQFDKTALPPGMQGLYTCAPVENKTLVFVPSDVLGYQWGTCYDAKNYWEQSLQEMQRAATFSPGMPPPDQTIEAIEDALGLRITADILPLLGKELGGYITDINFGGVFPVPEMVFFIQTTSREKVEGVIAMVLDKEPLLRPQEEEYKGRRIKYVFIPKIENFEPAYIFVNDYLLVATNRPTMRKLVDTLNDPTTSLVSNSGVQSLGLNLTTQGNAVFVLQVDQLMKKGLELMDWADKWVAQRLAQQQAFKAGSEKRLADIREEIKMQEQKIEDLESKLELVSQALRNVSDGDVPLEGLSEEEQRAEVARRREKKKTIIQKKLKMEEQIQAAEQSIETGRATEDELDQVIASLGIQEFDSVKRQFMVDEFIRPLLRSFMAIKAFASEVIFGDGLMESTIYFKME